MPEKAIGLIVALIIDIRKLVDASVKLQKRYKARKLNNLAKYALEYWTMLIYFKRSIEVCELPVILGT